MTAHSDPIPGRPPSMRIVGRPISCRRTLEVELIHIAAAALILCMAYLIYAIIDPGKF
jgi:hypothetical protein